MRRRSTSFDVDPVPGEELDFVRVIQLLWLQRYLILACIMTGLAGAGSYLALSKPMYTATAQILVYPQNQKIMQAGSALPELSESDTEEGPSVVNTRVELLSSRHLIAGVLNKLASQLNCGNTKNVELTSAMQQYSDSSSRPVSTENNCSGVESKWERGTPPFKTLSAFLERLEVKRRDRTYIVDVEFSDTDPGRAAFVVNTLLDVFQADQQAANLDATRGATIWFERQVADLGNQIQSNEEEIEKFKLQNNLVAIGRETLGEREISEFNKRVQEAHVEVAKSRARLKRMQTLSSDPERMAALKEALKSEVITNLRNQQATVERQLGELISRYGPNNPKSVSARAELTSIANAIKQELSRILQSVANEHEMAQMTLRDLEKDFGALRHKLIQRRAKAVKLSEMRRQADVAESHYNALLVRLQETRTEQKRTSSATRVVARAEMPERPSSPNKLLTLTLAFGTSAFAGVFLASVKETVTQPIRSVADARKGLSLDCLTGLPAIQKYQHRWLNAFIAKQPNSNVYRHILDTPESPFTREISRLKMRLDAIRGENTSKIIAIVSAREGEGKSTLAINLAEYLATAGTKTSLVDCDFRKRSVSETLVNENSLSVADFIAGDASVEDIAIKDPRSGVLVYPSPVNLGNRRSVDLFASDQFASFLRKLPSDNDVVILDTRSLDDSVDAYPLLLNADGILLVIESGATSLRDVKSTLIEIDRHRSKILGVVLNNLPVKRGKQRS